MNIACIFLFMVLSSFKFGNTQTHLLNSSIADFEICEVKNESNFCSPQSSGFEKTFQNFSTPRIKIGVFSRQNDRIEAYRRCLEKYEVRWEKFVPRDLTSDFYNQLNLQWNLRKQKVYPLAYFLPTSAQDVATGVKCGLQTRIHVVPNSGGHSYESIGWGTNHTLVVDFRNMHNMSVEGSGANAVGLVEPGALVGPVHAYFWENGGYAIPMGNCLAVGIGGHIIGGAVGYFSHVYGLAVDNVIEFEMVDGRGQIVVANERENSDLFWALRGHGPGYIGIVTRFKIKLFEASKMKITFIRLRYKLKDFSTSYIAFQNMLKWIRINEPTIFLGFTITSDTYNSLLPPISSGIEFAAVHIQDPKVQPKNNTEFLKILFQTFPKPFKIVQSYPSYIQFVVMNSYAPIISPKTEDVPSKNLGKQMIDLLNGDIFLTYLKSMRKDLAAPRYFKAKSFFIKKYFTRAQMDAVAAVLQRIPQNNIWILCNSEQGAIHDFQKTEMSYVHRDSLLDITIHYEGSSDPAQVHQGMKFLYELWDTVQFMDGGETYQNYPDLDVKDHLTRNYGQNLNRLVEQKRKWDPTNFFVTQLSLPLVLPTKNNTVS